MNKKLRVMIPLIVLAVVGFGGFTMLPANSLTMDVNPSIEIQTNRLNRVVGIKPLNLDAEQLLKEFNPKDKNLQKVVNDLVDLMILTGYIKGGDDNIVMITVKDNSVNSEALETVNSAIKALLENKQIEATILNQAIGKGESNSSGKAVVAEKISSLGIDKNMNELSNMTLKELISYSKENNIDTQQLFKVVAGDLDAAIQPSEYISNDEARKIALNLVDGEIVKFKLDDLRDDDDTPEYEIEIIKDGVKFEIEIDAFSGKVKEFERDDKDDKDKKVLNPAKKIISEDQARRIALEKINGKIVKLKLDNDDKDKDKDIEYEIKIIKDGVKYELEIDAYTGVITEFEREDDDDDYDDDDDKKSIKVNRTRISASEAKKIALNLVNGKITAFEEDDDEYEIKIVKDGREYEIEIDAYTGKVLKFEED